MFGLARATPHLVLMVLFFIQDLLAGPGPIAYTSMLQGMVPPDKLGRVFSTVSVLNGLAAPASFALTGLVMNTWPVTTLWVWAGALILLAYGPMTLLNKRILKGEREMAPSPTPTSARA